MSKRRKYADVLPILAQNKSIDTWHVHDSPYSFFGCKKIKPIMFYEGINTIIFRRTIAFAIALIVTSRSTSFEYTMSVHAVHAGAERNVCNIVVSTETPQTTTNPSQTLLPVYKLAHLPLPHFKSLPPRPPQPLAQPFAQMCYRCKYQVLSAGQNILEEYKCYNITHISLRACMHCTDWYGILEGTRAWRYN